VSATVIGVWEFIRCDHCGAPPGVWCVTRDGHEAARLHACRLVEVE
jgi:hypothetical protein